MKLVIKKDFFLFYEIIWEYPAVFRIPIPQWCISKNKIASVMLTICILCFTQVIFFHMTGNLCFLTTKYHEVREVLVLFLHDLSRARHSICSQRCKGRIVISFLFFSRYGVALAFSDLSSSSNLYFVLDSQYSWNLFHASCWQLCIFIFQDPT